MCQIFCKCLCEGQFDDKEVEFDFEQLLVGMDIMVLLGMEEMIEQICLMFLNFGSGKKQCCKVKIKEVLKLLIDEEVVKMLNEEEVKMKVVQNVEQNGIVFFDEIDKIMLCNNEGSGGEVLCQGVQCDLLLFVEGMMVNMKYGMVKIDYILFIVSGVFYFVKLSDLIFELQGCFLICVEFDLLLVNDFEVIFVVIDVSFVKQYQVLFVIEDVQFEFVDDGIWCFVEIVFVVNEKIENIGVCWLYMVIEKLFEEVLFLVGNYVGECVMIDVKYVDCVFGEVLQDEDLLCYVL